MFKWQACPAIAARRPSLEASLVKVHEGIATTLRHFSVSSRTHDEGDNGDGSGTTGILPLPSYIYINWLQETPYHRSVTDYYVSTDSSSTPRRLARTERQNIARRQVQNLFSQSIASRGPTDRLSLSRTQGAVNAKSLGVGSRTNYRFNASSKGSSDNASTAGAVDARNFAEARPGGPMKLLRASGTRLQGAPRGVTVGTALKGGPRANTGVRTAGPGRSTRGQRGSNSNKDRRPRSEGARRAQLNRESDQDDGEGDMSEEEIQYLSEKHEREKPKEVRYDPEAVTLEGLKQDWPAMPIGELGLTESVEEKVAWLARRMPHGYVTAPELAQRLYEGKIVQFESEEEQAEVIALAMKMSAERADKLTDRKGETIEPEDMSFVPMSEQERQELIETLLKGEYQRLEPEEKSSTLSEVVRSLRNNETYRAADSGKFLAKLQSLLPAQGQSGAARQASPRR